MQIKGVINQEDVVAFINHFVETSKVIRKRIFIIMVIYVILTFIAFRVIISEFTFGIFLFYVLLITLAVFFMPKLLRKRIAKVLSGKIDKTDPANKLGDYMVETSDKGMELVRGDDNKQLIEWNQVQRVYSDTNYYFLYYGGQNAVILPMRDMDRSNADFLELVSLHVEQKDVVVSPEREQKKRQKASLLVIAFALIAIVGYQSYHAYQVQPQYDFTDAASKVTALFEEEMVEDENGKSMKILKASATQKDIDEAMQAIAKIDTTKKRYEIYSLPVIALVVELNEAQKQLDERE